MTRTAFQSFSRIVLAAAMVPAHAVLAQAPTAPTQDTFHLHGVVLDEHTGKPISRAVVEAYQGRLAAFTDHDGRFALTLHFTSTDSGSMAQFQRSLLNTGSIYLGLDVRKPGYTLGVQRQVQQIAVSALASDLVFKLTPQSGIEGRVAAAGDDHPEGLRISLLTRRIQNGDAQWAVTSMATTDSRGEFRFANLQPGRYRLLTQDWTDDPSQPVPLARADKPVSRYAPASYPPTASGPDLKLAAGETGQVNFNLHPQTYFPIRIPVVLPPGGNPGLQTRVLLPGSLEGSQSGFSLRYNARDKVVEGVLPSGQYEINLQSNGPNASAAVVPLTVGGSRVETAPITLQPLPSIPVIIHQDLTRTTQPGTGPAAASAIAGRIQGGLIAGASGHGGFDASPVQIYLNPAPGSGSMVAARRRTGANGADGSDDTTLEAVPPGTYRLQATAPNGYIAAATSGGTDLLRQPLVVSAGSGVEPIEITVRDDTATIHGTIDSAIQNTTSSSDALDGFYDPSNMIFVTCIPTQPNGQRLLQGFVRRDGTFVLGNLPPGSYRIFASRVPLEGLEYRSETFTREYGSKGYSINLEPNGNANVTLTAMIEEIKDP